MSARTEIVPFWWTTLDELTARVGSDVTPYKIPASMLNGCNNWSGGSVVQIPLALSSQPATVARFFREGYEWVDVPEDVTATTLIDLFAELHGKDKVRFAHFDPLLIAATTAYRDIAKVKEGLGSHMVPKPDPVTGFAPPGWLVALNATQIAIAEAARAASLLPFEDLGRLHFDYWGNSEWRMGFLGRMFTTYQLPKSWDMNIMGIGAGNPILGLPAALPAAGMPVGQGLLAALAPQTLPIETAFAGGKIRMAKVLARKPLEGAAIRAIATPKGLPERKMNVVSVEPPRIELDGWSTQTLVPFYLNTWKTREAKLAFRITVPFASLKTVIEIVHQRHIVYSEVHELGAFIVPGVHLWLWDGFDSNGVFDSKVLKSNEIVARVTITDMQGRVSVATTELGTGPGNIRWTDVKVDTRLKTIDVSIFIRATKPSDHNFASVSFPLPKGTGAFLSKAIDGFGSNPALSMVPLFPEVVEKIPEHIGNPPPFVPALPKESIPRLLNDDRMALTAPFPSAFDLDPVLQAQFKRELLFGISQRWSRDVTLDGETYRLTAHVSERQSDAFWVILSAAAPKALDAMFGTGNNYIGPQSGSRSFNLASFGEGLPILYIYDDLDAGSADPDNQRDLGAHEFGHTVLREAFDPLTSACHKGTSDPIGAISSSAPVFLTTVPLGGLGDIMLYYPGGPDEARTWATEDDARALGWMTKVVFG